ncbi:MAG: aldehyde ferredoxin oxidoreductase C-terminal domain-containing protein, partial [Coriobacteriia bacterium]|nr:aldehyde ferredoxin oxidoreductase C-terminal domain-containing protein [Coriobacteriia bacterium]
NVWALGADCGIDDLDVIGELDRKISDLGLDTIEIGVTLAVYMDSGKLALATAPGRSPCSRRFAKAPRRAA